MNSTSVETASSEPVYCAGSLQYSVGGLRRVFAWLLAGELVFTLIDMLEPRLLPILLKYHGASDQQIAIIVGSFNALLQLIIMPPVGYCSDRLRTRWGRRIPLLLWVTPFVTLFLVVTPFAPEIASWLRQRVWLSEWLDTLAIPTTILVFGVLVLLYRSVQAVTNVAFFGLLRDVVPDSHMGRFLALFRLFGALGTFIITYWLIGHVETHSKQIFIGVGALNLVGFGAICWFVREGNYPAEVESKRDGRGGRAAAIWNGVKTFVSESYRHPVYLWVYFVRICLYGALLGLSGFIIFFPQYELGMGLVEVGQMLAWPSMAWLFLAYPVGKLIDAKGAVFVLGWGLALISLGYGFSFLLVVGPKTFFLSSMVTGIAFWIVMLAQLKLTQEIFHPMRYSQLAGANTIVQSILIAAIISPGAGWILQSMKGWEHTLAVPLVGDVDLGPYRFVNLMLGALYGLAWFGMSRVRHHWRTLGGAEGYVAPL